MWFMYALLTTVLWGTADLFYKKGASETDKYSHLKTTIFVGLVFGLHAIGTILIKGVSYDFRNLLIYLPVSLMYILSMIFGYFGLRYLELSISSPIQNSSGAVSAILLFILFREIPDTFSLIAIILISLGVFLLGFFEKKELGAIDKEDKKYKIGFVAFLMPVLYCIIDSLGTFLDGCYLDDFASTPLINVTEANFEDVANISYELTFLLIGILALLYITIIKKEKFNLRDFKNRDRLFAAAFETAGQAFYVYAMSGGNAIISAPLIGSYCIVSLVLSKIFLKEKLSKEKYISVFLVLIGILLMGIAEGLAE